MRRQLNLHGVLVQRRVDLQRVRLVLVVVVVPVGGGNVGNDLWGYVLVVLSPHSAGGHVTRKPKRHPFWVFDCSHANRCTSAMFGLI